MFFGSIPALVTPFAAGRVDEAAFRELIEWQIEEGSNALVPCGTTGEVATLDRRRASPADRAGGRGGAGPGAGDRRLRLEQYSTTRVELTTWTPPRTPAPTPRCVVPPYYNRPNQDGIYAHLPRGRRASTCRSSLYNVPGADGRRHSGRNDGATVAAAERHRGQGRHRQSRPGHRPAARLRRGIHPAVAAMTTWRWASTRWAGWAASRSPPMSRRGCAPISRRRRAKAAGTRRSTLQDRLYPLHAALFSRRLAGPGQICACRRSARASRPSCACR